MPYLCRKYFLSTHLLLELHHLLLLLHLGFVCLPKDLTNQLLPVHILRNTAICHIAGDSSRRRIGFQQAIEEIRNRSQNQTIKRPISLFVVVRTGTGHFSQGQVLVLVLAGSALAEARS